MKYFVELPEVWATEFLEKDPLCHGYWISSLTQSWQKGYADNCTLAWSNYVDIVRRLRMHTSKPIMVDADMLFNEPTIAATIAKELHTVGCDYIVIESKRFPKVNSLIPDEMQLNSPDEFCRLINKVKSFCPQLNVVGRLEHLNKTRDVNLTVSIAERAFNAGADSVIVHWTDGNDLQPLHTTLNLLKEKRYPVGLIPTAFLQEADDMEFEDLVNFYVLGNIYSANIHHYFSDNTLSDMISTHKTFKPILDRTEHYKPVGQNSLVVLGARPDQQGNFLLEDKEVVRRFEALTDHFFNIIFIVDVAAKITAKESEKIKILTIENSAGEIDSLSAANDYLNTEKTTVVYADIEARDFEYINKPGLVFRNDAFIGIFQVDTDALLHMLGVSPKDNSILEMAISHGTLITNIE